MVIQRYRFSKSRAGSYRRSLQPNPCCLRIYPGASVIMMSRKLIKCDVGFNTSGTRTESIAGDINSSARNAHICNHLGVC